MATRHLSRALQSATKPMSSILSHSYTTAAIPRSSLSRLRPDVAAATAIYVRRLAPSVFTRAFAIRQNSSYVNDPNVIWSNRPPKDTVVVEGRDFEHWLVVMEDPEADATRDDIIDSYIKTLAMVLGSEEEARMKIYSVSTRHYFAFGANVPEDVSYKIEELPKVIWVVADSYLDDMNKDYGGEPFINGQAVPYDPKYHEKWVRNNALFSGGNFTKVPRAGNQQIDPCAGEMQPQDNAIKYVGSYNYRPRGQTPPAANNQGVPQNAGYGQAQNQNTYGQGQNGYVPQNGGQGQNQQGGGYVNPNVAGRDPNY